MANPTRPVHDGILDPLWGQWVHDETDRGLAVRWARLTKTTDVNAKFDILNAELGLAAIAGAVVSLDYAAIPNVVYVTTAVHTVPGGAWTWVLGFNDSSNDIVFAPGVSVTVNVMAWGTPLAAASRPGVEVDRPELNPLEETGEFPEVFPVD